MTVDEQEACPCLRQTSPWVCRFAHLVPASGLIIDVACGRGRHSRYFLERGHPVIGVDRDISGLAELRGRAGFEAVEADLEGGEPWPFEGRQFAGIVVANYLYRPLLPVLVASLVPSGVLIYDTFARGNERFARPRNPDHLLKAGELYEAVRGKLCVVAYEHGEVREPWPAVVQRIVAINQGGEAVAPKLA